MWSRGPEQTGALPERQPSALGAAWQKDRSLKSSGQMDEVLHVHAAHWLVEGDPHPARHRPGAGRRLSHHCPPCPPSSPSIPRSRNLRTRPRPRPRSPEVGRAGRWLTCPGVRRGPGLRRLRQGAAAEQWGPARTLRGAGVATKSQPHRSPWRHGPLPHTPGPHRFVRLFHTLRVSRLIKAALAVPSLCSKRSEKTLVPTSKEDRTQDSLSRYRAPSARDASPPGFLRMRSRAAPPSTPSLLRTGTFFQAPPCGRALPDLAAVRMRAPLRQGPGAQSSLRSPPTEAQMPLTFQ